MRRIKTERYGKACFNADDESDRFELFLLDDGQQKVEYKEETRKTAAPPFKSIR